MKNFGVNWQAFDARLLQIITSYQPPIVIKPRAADRREVNKRNDHENVVGGTEDTRQGLSLLAETLQVDLGPEESHKKLKSLV